MTDQLPYQGPSKIVCPCGCGKFGTPKKRTFRVRALGRHWRVWW